MPSAQLSRKKKPSPKPRPHPTGPVDHVVIIVKENHTFDNYFGKFPGTNGDSTLAPAPDPPPSDPPIPMPPG